MLCLGQCISRATAPNADLRSSGAPPQGYSPRKRTTSVHSSACSSGFAPKTGDRCLNDRVLDSVAMVSPNPQELLAQAQARLSELLRNSPAADLERNLRALLAQSFQKLELVTREEFELERERLALLEARIRALETRER